MVAIPKVRLLAQPGEFRGFAAGSGRLLLKLAVLALMACVCRAEDQVTKELQPGTNWYAKGLGRVKSRQEKSGIIRDRRS